MATKASIAAAYRSWIEGVNDRDLNSISRLISDQIIHNGDTFTKDGYIHHITSTLTASSVSRTDLDMLTVNNDASTLAARLIHQGTLTTTNIGAGSTAQRAEWPEHVFVWFNPEGKISQTRSLIDTDILRSGEGSIPRTPEIEQSPLPPGSDIAAMYRDYIHAINTLTMKEHFGKYCHPVVTHNTRELSLDDYRLFIEGSFENIKGLNFNIKEIVADDEAQHVAARLEFTGTPVKEFMGIQPNGRGVRFWEHVFYRLDGGKILWVWAMLDLEAFRKCLEGEGEP